MIYKIDTWVKYDTSGTITQTLYCLSDMHGIESVRPQDILSINKIDQEQRVLITNYAQQLKKDNALFIVEDPFELSGDTHKKIAAFIPLQKQYGFTQPDGQKPVLLHFLTDSLRQWGCDVVNVEYRQQRIISHIFYAALLEFRRIRSPLLTPYTKNINTLYGATLPEVAQETERALAYMREYRNKNSDNQTLDNYYGRVIIELEKTISFADLLRKHNYFYWNCMDAASHTIRSLMLDAFLLWGHELLDAHALHTITNAPDRKKICIIMGGLHIYNISMQLPILGYHKISSVGSDSLTEQEHEQRIALISELCDVNQFVPIESHSRFNSLLRRIKHLFSKNIFVSEINVNADKMVVLKELCTKFAYVNQINSTDFEILLSNKLADKSPVIDVAGSINEQQSA